MHASISTFTGDPDELLARYDALLAEVPTTNMRMHICLRAPDGIVVLDTCPTREVFESFHRGDAFRLLLAGHGLPEPAIENFPLVTSQATAPELDGAKVGAFIEQTLRDGAGMFAGVMTVIGDRLGLFRSLAGDGPATAGELARRAEVDERYALEWPRGMRAAGYVELTEDGRFALPPEHAQVLAAEGGPFFMAGAFELTFAYLQIVEAVIEAFRHGGGVPQADYPETTWTAMARFSRPIYDNLLVEQWVPAVAGLSERRGAGASWADVGCGSGRAVLRLAEAFPNSTFAGYDQFEGQLELARTAAAAAGVSDRVRFELLDAAGGIPERFDVISTFDVVHDAADPERLVGAIREALAQDGLYLVAEMSSADDPDGNVGPLATLMYGVSILYCMTTSLAQHGHGLGTLGLPEARLRELCERQGLRRCVRLPINDPFNAIYEVRR